MSLAVSYTQCITIIILKSKYSNSYNQTDPRGKVLSACASSIIVVVIDKSKFK